MRMSVFPSAIVLAAASVSAAAANEIQVDLELVLAVDASSSMADDEQYLQRQGYVAAFQSPIVLTAIRSGPLQRIAVAYAEWGDPNSQAIVLPWLLIDGRTSAMEVAFLLADAPMNHFFGTSIAGALRYSGALFDANGFNGERRVIDISGDGPNNLGAPVAPARDAVLGQGITINGLPIMTHLTWGDGLYGIEGLDFYFEDCVIGGPGAFVIPIKRREDIATAIRQKLVLDIVGPKKGLLDPVGFVERPKRVDCLAGERNSGRILPLKPKKPLSN
jgi:hypothetical protein